MNIEPKLVRHIVLREGSVDHGAETYFEFHVSLPGSPDQPTSWTGCDPPRGTPWSGPDTGPIRQAYNRPPYLSGWKPGDPTPD